MGKITNGNYIHIQGWMVNEPFSLKGNDLLVYAIIYGFSQAKNQCFNGSLAYLCEWTGSTRQGIIKNLNHLIEWGYITKVEAKPTNYYYVTDINNIVFDEDVNSVPTKQSLPEDVNKVTETSKPSLHNNITNTNNINNTCSPSNIEDIISYLNKTCGTHFKSNTTGTKKFIQARLKEGFTLEDFKKVIDTKYEDWGRAPFKFSSGQLSSEYLRPSTLFGNKFENYLAEADARSKPIPSKYNSVSMEIDPERSDMVF